MNSVQCDRVYKQNTDGWIVFGKRPGTNRRFRRTPNIGIIVPIDSRPVKVIESTKYLILLTYNQEVMATSTSPEPSIRDKETVIKEAIMGKYTVHSS